MYIHVYDIYNLSVLSKLKMLKRPVNGLMDLINP